MKLRSVIHYFGNWATRKNGVLVATGDGWKESLAAYKKVTDDLHAGRPPRTATGELTVVMLCNHYLTAKPYRLVKEFGKGRLVGARRPRLRLRQVLSELPFCGEDVLSNAPGR
jgi:hypothetical protein